MKRVLRMLIGAMAIASLAAPMAYAIPTCEPTSQIATTNYPGVEKIPTSNNLLIPPTKSVPVEGQQLILSGRIVDRHCMPVPEAIVEIWQADPFGRWFLASARDLASPDPTFAGAGRTVTDGEGRFTFITVFPGAVPSRFVKGVQTYRTPHINIRIKADGFKNFSTVLFFANDRRNKEDDVYQALSMERRGSVAVAVTPDDHGVLNGGVNLVLPGYTPYRTY